MHLTTKGRYGLRAMLELAQHYDQGPIFSKDISRAQDISEKYLEQILFILKNNGLVKSRRGTKGGYSLARPPAQIKLLPIIRALEGSLAPARCVDEPSSCKRVNMCVMRTLWERINDAAQGILDSTTLEDLIQEQKKKNKTGLPMFYI